MGECGARFTPPGHAVPWFCTLLVDHSIHEAWALGEAPEATWTDAESDPPTPERHVWPLTHEEAVDRAEAAERTLAVATLVAELWRDEMLLDMGWPIIAAHPLAMVLAALNGETDPRRCGLDPDIVAGLAALAEITGGDR